MLPPLPRPTTPAEAISVLARILGRQAARRHLEAQRQQQQGDAPNRSNRPLPPTPEAP